MLIGIQDIAVLHERIRGCTLCRDAGFPIDPAPIAAGIAPATFMIVGQAPSLSDKSSERMYTGPAGKKLFGWMRDAGFTDVDFATRIYLSALTKCFPGRLPGKSTDRAPSAREVALCRPWLDREMALVKPKVVILFGKMAIDHFLGKGAPLTERIGRTFVQNGVTYVPLPHSSGASTWLNNEAHRALANEAIERLRVIRAAFEEGKTNEQTR